MPIPTIPSPAAAATVLLPVLAAVLFFHLHTFDPAPYPPHELTRTRSPPRTAPRQNGHILQGSEKIGEGEIHAPEDISIDPSTGVIYTGGDDGWISRVTPGRSAADTVVEKWVNTGGRPLGIAHGLNGEVIVADADKGLLNISKDGVIELLTDEADGLKFKLTDYVSIGPDGTLYFTDASSKYNIKEATLDLLEGRPNGRLLSYDPSTKQTRVLVKDLYFANGVTLSADKSFIIFCETSMCSCKRYYIQGPKKGMVDMFIENLPGLPDNIKYDGEGQYWIAMASESNNWNMIKRYPFIRKIFGILEKHNLRPVMEKNGGVIVVDLDGNPIALYCDRNLQFISTGIQIGDYIYLGSIIYPYIIRFNVSQYPATPIA